MSDELINQQWVYIGRHRGQQAKFVDGWMRLDEKSAPLAGSERFFRADRKRRTIGGIYNVMTNEAGTKLRVGAFAFKTINDPKLVAQWRLNHDAVATEAAIERKEKLATEDELALLKPLRELYFSTPSVAGRLAIEVQVLAYLRMMRT